MLVSIITPMRNAVVWLEQSVKSAQAQTLKDWEMIVVDDCSNDHSYALAQKLAAEDPRIKLIRLEKNCGAAVARNKAITEAQGRYIAFLDSDDLWYPQKLEKQIQFMQEKNIAFSYTAYEKINENGKAFVRMGVPSRITYEELLKTNVIGCLTAVYDTQKLGKIYMPTNTKREDYATWLNILKQNTGYALTDVLGQYRVYAEQSSSKKLKMIQENWHLYRHIEGLSFFSASYYFANYLVRGALRTKTPGLARALGVLQ